MRRFVCLCFSVMVLIEGMVFAAGLSEKTSIEGKKVVVLVTKSREGQRREKVRTSAVVKGRELAGLGDMEQISELKLMTQDQQDENVGRFLGVEKRTWYYRDGAPFDLPIGIPELEGRKVSVRVYQAGLSDPEAYDTVGLTVKDGKVSFEIEGESKSSFVVIFGRDQSDEVLRSVFGDRVYGWPWVEGLWLRVPRMVVKDEEEQEYWTILDGAGFAAGGVTAEVYLQGGAGLALIARGQVDEEGRFKGLPGQGRASAMRSRGVASSRFLFKVSHEEYGTSYIEHRSQAPVASLYIPSVPAGSEADARSAWGAVVDPNGMPVSGATVRGIAIVTLGDDWIRTPRTQRVWVKTDDAGRFRIYLPVSEEAYQIGLLIPPKTEYQVKIEGPAGSDAVEIWPKIMNGQDNEIVLGEAKYLHKFVFVDANGPVIDADRLTEFRVVIERNDEDDVWLKYEDFKDGGRYPVGRYKVSHESLRFASIDVMTDSPEELVFKLRPDRIYYGRVVHGVTQEPIVGALAIAAAESHRRQSLGYMTDKEWEALRSLGDDVTASDDSLRQSGGRLAMCYTVNSMVRSNRHGWFEIGLTNNVKTACVAVLEQGYLPVHLRLELAKRDEDGDFLFSEVKLFPAGKIVVRPDYDVDPNKWHEMQLPGLPLMGTQWFIDKANSPAWAEDLIAACGDEADEGVYRGYELDVVKIQGDYRTHRLLMPAGVSFRLNLRSLNSVEWGPITIADGLKLEQGQLLDLGRHRIIEPFEVLVKVVNSQGKGIEGVPVIVCGGHDPAVSSSDDEGVAIFDFVGYSKGDFIVEHNPEDSAGSEVMRESVPYEIKGPADAHKVFTITVSDAMLSRLFE